jgi:hypothetical protein
MEVAAARKTMTRSDAIVWRKCKVAPSRSTIAQSGLAHNDHINESLALQDALESICATKQPRITKEKIQHLLTVLFRRNQSVSAAPDPATARRRSRSCGINLKIVKQVLLP